MAFPPLYWVGIASCRSCLQPFYPAITHETMANYFYFDANGEKQGPVDEAQVEKLIAQGIIELDWQLETEDGRTIEAKQISRLFTSEESSIQWQFDFDTHWFTCRLVFILSTISAVVLGFVITYRLFQFFDMLHEASKEVATSVSTYFFFSVAGIWIFVALTIAATRLICEWSLITSKAAQIYIEKTSQEKT